MDEDDSSPDAAEYSLQALLDNIPDVIFFKDTDSRFTRVNHAYASYVGLTDPRDVIGKSDADFFPEAEAREFLADEHHLLTTGEALIGKPESHLGADGQTRWVLTNKVPIRNGDGHITGLVGISRDITQSKVTEDDLRASEWRHSELLAEASRQAQELALLGEVRTALARELELPDLFRTVVEGIARTFGYTLVSLYMLEDDVLVLQHQVGYDYQIQRILVTEGVSGRAVRTGQPVLLEDVRDDRDFLGAVTGIVSELCVPLRDAGQIVGFLNVESRDGVRLTKADLRLMVALSEHVNVAIGRARLYTEARRSEARFSSLIQNALDIITILDADGTVHYESPAAERALGYEPDELVGSNAFDLVHPDDLPAVYPSFLKMLDDPTLTPAVEFRFRHRDGSWRWLDATGTNLIADPAVGGVVVNSRDVTARKEAEDALQRSEARFRSLIQNALDIITIVNADGTVRYASPAIERVLGYQEDELVGSRAFGPVHPDDQPLVDAAFLAALDDPELIQTVEFRFRHRNGSWRWIEATGTNLLADPAVSGIVVNSRDITERKEIDGRLWHQAHHDPLTGLPNRTLFMDRLNHALSESGSASVAVFFLDLNGFKVINDSLGHEYGDRLLAAAAERLASRLRPGDLLARFGGDEFTILREQVTDASMATKMAERVVEALAAPFALTGHEVSVSASVGTVLSSPELTTPTDLLRAADVALYRAKAKGQGGTAVFDATRDASALARLDRETALRHALEWGEFLLHYQPQFELTSGRLLGVEALVRWQHPTAGLLPPAAFIPLAEEMGLIVPLGVWVLGEACRQVMAWQEQFPHVAMLGMCVNVSPVQVRHPDLVGQVKRVLRETGLAPERLTLEITERGLVEDTEATDHTVEALKALGVQLAIDDFGAYQAGLGYLRRWPMDMLKLDQTLIADIDRDERSRAIVAAVTGLAQKLGMTVTGEGIETAEQLAWLRELGCTWGQGYFSSPPLPPGELVAFLKTGRSASPDTSRQLRSPSMIRRQSGLEPDPSHAGP